MLIFFFIWTHIWSLNICRATDQQCDMQNRSLPFVARFRDNIQRKIQCCNTENLFTQVKFWWAHPRAYFGIWPSPYPPPRGELRETRLGRLTEGYWGQCGQVHGSPCWLSRWSPPSMCPCLFLRAQGLMPVGRRKRCALYKMIAPSTIPVRPGYTNTVHA